MADRSALAELDCPNPTCGHTIKIEKRWTAGGVNDCGGYVLRCTHCRTVFDVHLGRDIMDSRVLSGADVLDTYDDELKNKAEVLARHGLTDSVDGEPSV